MYEIRDLRMVQAIHQHGSLARAARALGVGQPGLTRQLASLEARVRGHLFDRSGRGTIATDLGLTVIAQATDILERMDRLNRDTEDLRGNHIRSLTIAAGAYMAESVCQIAAGRLVALQPQIRTRLLSVNWADLPAIIHSREAAIGVMDIRSAREDPALELERLHPHPGVFVVRPGHPLTKLSRIGLADILSHPLIMISRIPAAVYAPMAEARAGARSDGKPHPAFPALVQESPTVGLSALPHSDLVAAVTAAMARPAVDAGQIVVLPWRATWLSVHPAMVWLRQRSFSPPEKQFLDLVRLVDRELKAESEALCARFRLDAGC
ncbi:LysR family transcriptional regulator [Roseococcus sp. YIM B11640]|uniref:LysR family transcriptional regulator n=1 Tax=Roseococcus sp. YIM B11640 TaxID=3133973 RepID=UPI003C7BD998